MIILYIDNYMTQEDKNLLLKDLCARLPYRVICRCDNLKVEGILREIGIIYNMCKLYDSFTDEFENCYIFDCKPYLFPLSSMTEEQLYNNPIGFSQMLTIKADRDWENITINRRAYYKLVDWFNKNHFDYRGLIPMGLAIDATGLNIY